MSVTVPGARPKVNHVSGDEPRLKPEKKVWVKNPRTGEQVRVSISNARDMVERRKKPEAWLYASALPKVNEMPSIAEQKAVDEVEKAKALLRAAGELPADADESAVDPIEQAKAILREAGELPPVQDEVAVPQTPTLTPGANGAEPDHVAASATEDE